MNAQLHRPTNCLLLACYVLPSQYGQCGYCQPTTPITTMWKKDPCCVELRHTVEINSQSLDSVWSTSLGPVQSYPKKGASVLAALSLQHSYIIVCHTNFLDFFFSPRVGWSSCVWFPDWLGWVGEPDQIFLGVGQIIWNYISPPEWDGLGLRSICLECSLPTTHPSFQLGMQMKALSHPLNLSFR